MKYITKEEKGWLINSLVSLLAAVLLIVARGDALFEDFVCFGTILLLIANAMVNGFLFVGTLLKYRRDRDADKDSTWRF
jgi:hypothetical protein